MEPETARRSWPRSSGRACSAAGSAGAPEAACLIAIEDDGVNLRLRQSDEAFPAETTIAGRPAASTEDSDGNVEFTVALTGDALRQATRQYRPPGRYWS